MVIKKLSRHPGIRYNENHRHARWQDIAVVKFVFAGRVGVFFHIKGGGVISKIDKLGAAFILAEYELSCLTDGDFAPVNYKTQILGSRNNLAPWI